MGDGAAGRLFSAQVEIESLGSLPYSKVKAEFEELFEFKPNGSEERKDKSVRFVLEASGDDDGLSGMPFASGPRVFNLSYDEDLKIKGSTDARLPLSFVTTISHRTRHEPLWQLSEAIEQGEKSEIESALTLFNPEIDGLEIVSPRGQTAVVKLRHKRMGLVPLTAEGDGIRRFLTLASAIVAARNGVLLVDEIETALHATILSDAFQTLAALCKKHNVQVFATTHSLEALDAMLFGAKDKLEKLKVFRLPKIGSELPVKVFSGELADSIRHESGLDLR
jgi:AAA15 family ATPase/GTPase